MDTEKIKIKVDWDCEDEERGCLPEIVEIPPTMEEYLITDYLSDTYGFCVNYWDYV